MLRLISGSPTPNNSGLWLFAARVCVLDVKKHIVTLPNKTRIRRDPSQFLRRPLLNNRHLQTQFSNAHFHHYKCLTDLQATVKSARADHREMRALREMSPTLAVLQRYYPQYCGRVMFSTYEAENVRQCREHRMHAF